MVSHKITVHNRQINKSISLNVPHGEFIFRFFETSGHKLPSSCRNGCCTTCAVKILSGTVDQSLGIGLSEQLQKNGYALLCIAKAIGPLEVETQDEDEVYEIQFGKFLDGIRKEQGNPFDI